MNAYAADMVTREFNITVICEWDAETKVWYAMSKDLPGLVTEANDIPALIQRVMEIAPELIEDNLLDGKVGEEFLLNLTPVYQQTVRIAAR